MKEVYEKAGLFYLGKDVDKTTQEVTELLTLLKNKNFTTHAAIIGMTGSGKTGLGIGLIEEAAIDNIPSIIIDPKGDMGNLCLSDANFSIDSFEKWVAEEANTQGIDAKELASQRAKLWKDGIYKWGQDSSRVEKFTKVKKTIYTPGSLSGVPVNVISSLKVPSLEVLQDSDAYTSYLKTTTVSLMALLGMDVDAMDSKEYVFLAQIISDTWLQKKDLNIQELIAKIIEPPFEYIGVLPLDSFFPKKERFALATRFNTVIASPDFSLWLQGDSLDIQKLLYDTDGKAKISIFSISHLNDEQRMFFVTLLLNQYISWMRRQSGSTSLKALLYMDEIYGYFPPTKNPPSKEPMMILLKQARAFGLGVVLSTQNPVDLDYKGLSNIGTWFIGRLQTKQDIQKVIDGLGGKVGSSFQKDEIKQLLSNLNKRVFFLKSTHLEDVKLFTTRWVMSYLKGPLSKKEISLLMDQQKNDISKIDDLSLLTKNDHNVYKDYQRLDESISQYFEPSIDDIPQYISTISVISKLHFIDKRRNIDNIKNIILSLPIDKNDKVYDWQQSIEVDSSFMNFPTNAPSNAKFQEISDLLLKDKGLKLASKELKEYLYQTQKLVLYRCKDLKLDSLEQETKMEFQIRVQDVLNEQKDIAIEKLQERYDKKLKTLLDRLERAKDRVSKEQQDSTSSMLEAGISILGALFGRTTPTKLGRAVSKGSKILKERGDLSRAEQRVAKIQDDIEDLEYELEDKIETISQKYTLDNIDITPVYIKPKKGDIDLEHIALVWRAVRE